MPRHTIAAPTAKAERIRASNTPKPAEHFLRLDGRQVQQLVFLSAGITDATSHYCGSNCEGGTYPGEQYAKASGTFSESINYQMDGVAYNDTYVNTNLPFP